MGFRCRHCSAHRQPWTITTRRSFRACRRSPPGNTGSCRSDSSKSVGVGRTAIRSPRQAWDLRARGSRRLRRGGRAGHVGATAHGRAARARSDGSHQPRIGGPPARPRSVARGSCGVHRRPIPPQRHCDRACAFDEPNASVGRRHGPLVPRDIGNADDCRSRSGEDLSPPVGRVDRLSRSARSHVTTRAPRRARVPAWPRSLGMSAPR